MYKGMELIARVQNVLSEKIDDKTDLIKVLR
jgi:hypothetical protein